MKINKLLTFSAVVALLITPLMAEAQRGQGGQGGGQQGQGRQGGMRMMGGGMMGQSNMQLVQRADVQADLKLTADQKSAITKLQEDQQAAMRARMEEMRNGGGGGFDPTTMQAEFQKLRDEQDAAVNKVLNTEQQARLKQIAFQMRGNRALLDKDVQKDLGLDKDQVRKIEDLQDAQNKANQEVFARVQNGEIDRTEVQAVMDKNNKILDEELMKVLNADQVAKFKGMGGPEFKRDPKVDEAMRNRGGRGGGGGN